MIHLYGVVDGRARVRPDLTVITAGKLACVGTPCDGPPPSDLSSLAGHDAVVAELMAGGPVIPFRYGTVIDGEREGRQLLLCGGARFEALLQRLRGRVELAVRAAAHPDATPATPPRGSGRLYLASLAGGSAAAVLAALHRSLAARAAGSTCTIDAGGFMRSSYLVGIDDVESFRDGVTREVLERPGVHDVSLTGPWAPYSFVTDGDTAWAEAVNG